MARDRCLAQAYGVCKPTVSPFAGLNNERKPVLKRHGDGNPVEPTASLLDLFGNCFRDKVQRDVPGPVW